MPRRPSLAPLAAAWLLAAPIAGGAQGLAGEVVGVADGDTLTVLVDRVPVRVRLAEIDAPERDQPWGARAKQALGEKVLGRAVEVRVGFNDRYGRSVAHVRCCGGRDINREMVREGHAWVFRRWMRDDSLLDDEAHARGRGVGVWGLPEDQRSPPWEWRERTAAPAPPRGDDAQPPPSSACGAKRYCREMASCEEARFHLRECDLRRLDGDGDGVPCENLCR